MAHHTMTSPADQYRHVDTKRPDGFYIRFERLDLFDQDASPNEYLFQDPEYQAEDQKRLDAYNAGDWYFIGIRARAHCLLIRNNVGTFYTLEGPGLWGIESDSDADYLQSVYQEQIEELKTDISAMTSPIYEE